MRHRRNSFRPVVGLLLLLTLATWQRSLGAEDTRTLGGEAGLLVGLLAVDEDLSGESGTIDLALGGRGGSVFTPRLIFFIDALYSRVSTRGELGDADLYWGRAGLEWLFVKRPRSSWFVNGALGWMKADYAKGVVEDFHRPLVSAGFGQRYAIGGRKQLRWELRGDVSVDDPGLNGAKLQQGLFVAGLIWGPGGQARGVRDEDGDGVRNARERCPGTPPGAAVDRRGCPLDSDGDGVFDGIDSCAMTPPHQLVNEIGCPRDSDGDGILDGADACPDTPEGVVIDEWGCPRDRDRDGVPEGIDRCPRTPLGILVDEQGCALDSDGDGVPDGPDRCPETAEGSFVDAQGCATSPFLWIPERRTVVVWLEFEVNSADLDEAAKLLLDEVVSVLEESDYRFEIGGHIDPEAGESNLDRLSAKRAEAVRDYLVQQGIEEDRLEAHGYGATRPLSETPPSRLFGDGRIELTRID
jgi:hypothetical protein